MVDWENRAGAGLEGADVTLTSGKEQRLILIKIAERFMYKGSFLKEKARMKEIGNKPEGDWLL